MKLVYYTQTAFLDTALPHAKALSKFIDVYFFLEVSPGSWNKGIFDINRKELPSGIIPAKKLLQKYYPPGIHSYWEGFKNIFFVVYNSKYGLHPSTFCVSQKTKKFIQKLKPDIIHLDDVSSRMLLALPRFKKIPIVLNIHDPEPHTGEYGWKITFSQRIAFSRINHFVIHNRYSKEHFIKKHNLDENKISINSIGALEIFRELTNNKFLEEKKTVLFFGRLSPYKGLEYLIEAAKEVCQSVTNVKFIVAGRPMPNYQIPDFPKLPNGGAFELYLNYISNDNLSRLFQRSTLVVCPYIDATQSGVVLTAYAYEKPVICTRVGGLPEYIWDGETGHLVPPKDYKALADVIIRLFENPDEREAIKQNIVKRNKQDLSWDLIAKKTVQVYSKIIP